jgi:cell division protein FtsN
VRYGLQVGSAPSKQEAEKIAARLKAEQKKALAKHAVEVDQSGGNNPVWRVRIGPYATANEPRNLCVRLRQSGYDCLVVME